MRLHSTRRSIAVLAAVVLTVPFMASAAFGASSHRVSVAGTKPAWAQSARAVGTLAGSGRISFSVALKLRNQAQAESLLRSVSSPSNEAYGSYLSASQFNGKYGPSNAAVAQVRSFLKSAGFKVGSTAAGNRWVNATGTVAQINKAFATTLRTYTVSGKRLRAPSTTLSVPSSVASNIVAVTGLTEAAAHPNVVRPDAGATVQPADAPVTTSACSTYWNQYQQTMPEAYGRTSFPTYICGYTPKQIRGAYGIDSAVSHGTNGHGVTVAIIDAYDSPTILADANAYATAVGEPQFAPGQFIDTSDPSAFINQDQCGDWSTEQSLDVESVHGMAPGATVHYYGGFDCITGIDAQMNTIIQTHSAQIVSNSYGYNSEELDPAQLQMEHSMYLQAGLEGIGLYFSSGDDGDNAAQNTGDAQPSYASSDPLVTGVGGTSLAINSHNGYQWETGWGSYRDFVDYSGASGVYEEPVPGDFYGGAGGGVSTLFAQPWYQKGTVPNKLAKSRGGAAMRVVPDISADADPYTGFAYGQTVGGVFTIGGIGGTSLACPLIAGMQADASTHRLFPIGFANPLLYAVGGFAFRDVTPPRSIIAVTRRQATALVTFNEDSSLTVTKGYDDVTGMGSPKGAQLLLAELLLP
jgi:subtilase family serine protease